ncbi:GatB/YqeY domain-containing protein [Primorskyibacter sp. S187A]|uniref:GatB/YqeY domain-containing protein n=1 Tax=Primorskyibacter sp. S187A TaxID=3415130 RepID=UPI003C7C2F6F
MDLKSKITTGLKQAMKDKAADRLATLRLISAAIKDREIAMRGEGKEEGVSEADVTAILAKMVKQRQESARTYEEGGRLDLAERELNEITVIEEFLPRQLDDGEVEAAIVAAMEEVGASSIRDMGKVMGALKSGYAGQMDFGAVGPMVKDRLAASG